MLTTIQSWNKILNAFTKEYSKYIMFELFRILQKYLKWVPILKYFEILCS